MTGSFAQLQECPSYRHIVLLQGSQMNTQFSQYLHFHRGTDMFCIDTSNIPDPATEVARAYDMMAPRYDEVDTEAFYHNQYRAYSRHLSQHSASIHGRVLDLGCGTGLQIGFVKSVADSVVGIDISEGLLAQARKKFPDVEFRCADACNLPFENDSFDTVISYGEVISHIPTLVGSLLKLDKSMVFASSV